MEKAIGERFACTSTRKTAEDDDDEKDSHMTLIDHAGASAMNGPETGVKIEFRILTPNS